MCFTQQLKLSFEGKRWMQMQKTFSKKREIYRKILSCYIVGLLMIASFVTMLPRIHAEGPSGDYMITFFEDQGGMVQSSGFDIDDIVFVNVSLDNLFGPAEPPYCLYVTNNNTDETIFFPVYDNVTYGPWGDENQPDDGCFWGFFNLTDSEDSHNAGENQDALLNVSVGNTIYIFEDNGGDAPNPLWDNDADIAAAEITIEGQDDHEHNYEPDVTSADPSNTSTDVSQSLSSLSVLIEDPEGDHFDWYITTSPDIGSDFGSDETNGTKSCTVGPLAYDTTYYWYVNCSDYGSGNWTNETFWFTTETDSTGGSSNNSPEFTNPYPNNQTTGVPIDISHLYVSINDSEGDLLNWSIETSPNIGSNITSNDENGTKYCDITGSLAYDTTYYWYVNCSDYGSGNWTNETFWFATTSAGGNNPPNRPNGETPPDGSVDRPTDTAISWSCDDPDGDDVTFDIYFGSSNPPGQIAQNHTSTSYTLMPLDSDTTYYWRIVAWDTHDESNSSEIWSFTTETDGGGQQGDESGNSSVSGYVKWEDNGERINGAEIEIINNATGYMNNTISDGEGYYNFTDLPTGDYDLMASKEMVFPSVWNSISISEDYTHVENLNFSIASGGDDPGGDGIEGEVNITVTGSVYMERSDLAIPYATVSAAYPRDNPTTILNSTETAQNGQFELHFSINQSVSEAADGELCFVCSAEGYVTNYERQEGIRNLITMMEYEGIVDIERLELEKIWDITAHVNGTIRDIDTNEPISNVTVAIEGPNYFENQTETDENGNFSVGCIAGDADDFEVFFAKDGYFTNATEIETAISNQDIDLGTLYMETKPPSNAFIEGFIKSESTPLEDVQLILYDPLHPYESEKDFFDMPSTDETGYYNTSTYAGTFYLITLAKIIGETREGPPLGIGGYINNVIEVTVAANETLEHNISLTATDPDDIHVNLNIVNTNLSYAQLSRTITGNPQIIRIMTDSDLNGQIDADEADTLKSSINASFTQSGYFEENMLLARIPFSYYQIDDTYIQPQFTTVEISGIIGDTTSTDPITIYANMSMTPNEEIDTNDTIHSIQIEGYYGNPAFNMNYTVRIPQTYSFKNRRQWMLTTTELNQTTVRSIPNNDPNWNDTSFTEPIIFAVGTSEPLAEFNEGYFYENPYDSDADGDYDYFITKVKVNVSQSGSYKVEAKLCSSNGVMITNTDTQKTLSSGSRTIELSFDAERIYRKKIDGPYTIVYDVSYLRNSSYVWFDSAQKVTESYEYSDFTKPDIFFTGTILDSGLDENNDGLYEYLQIGLQVDVGTLGYYEFEGDIGTCDFSYDGDPYIGGVRKGVTFVDYDEQYVNLSFDGGAIYAKGCNASIWVNIRVRSQTGSELDEIQTMTNKYNYNDFSPPPPENCTITGYITDAHGNPLDADIWLWDEITMSENTTSVNESTGEYSINAKAGVYELQINPSDNNYDGHWELVYLDVNETFNRNITLLPRWSQCAYLERDIDNWQYAAGEDINIEITSAGLPNSNCTLEIFKEYVSDGDHLGEEYYATLTNTTDSYGQHEFVINTIGFSTGEYMFRMWVENESYSTPVARDDIWDIQISSLSLEFDIDKNNYRPGSTGNGTYTLSYISNSTEVANADYSWKIVTWDWMGEHTLSSGSFTDTTDGHGWFSFTIPSTADDGDWYDIKLTATAPSGDQVFTSKGIGITEGSIIESVEDFPLGTPGDYDFLVYNVTVNVTSAGTYRVEAGLEDSNNNWITFNDTQSSLGAGSHMVQIYFDGEQIKASQAQEGNWHSWIGLFYSTSWNSLDDLDYTTTRTYNKNNFSTPAVCFEDVFSHHTLDGPNGYVGLVANATINASVCGDYRVDANLYKEVLQSGGWYDWQGISWNNSGTITISEGGENEPNTSILVPIRLEGSDIYNSGYNGPYNINFNLHREYGTDTWITNYDPDTDLNYDYDQFARPGAVIVNISDHGPVDGDLEIGVNINVSDGYEGTYEIKGDIHSSDWYWITWDSNETYLNSGITEVNITLSGESIYSAGYNGPYNLYVSLHNNNDWISNEYTTDAHSYTDFSTPGAIFEGSHSDQGYDEDNNGYYDYLQVTVPVDISEVGSTYEVSGELYKETSTSWNWITWESEEFTPATTGLYNVTICFSASQIGNSGQEGYYGVNLWLRQLGGSELDYLDFTTDNSYSLGDFEQPSVRFIENNSYPSDSNDSQYLYTTLRINSSETGSYHVHGSLHKVINQGGWDNWIWIADTEEEITFSSAGEQDVTLSFDISGIQTAGYNGPYTISFEIMDSNWNMLDNLDNYETDFYDFTGLGDIRPIYFTDDHDDYQRASDGNVVVNVTLQVNETGTYSIGGDLHKESSNDWNFIAGQWENMQLIQDSDPQEIQLYFDSIEILSGIQSLSQSMQSTFATGTRFDIDVWVRRAGEWSDLDHFNNESINTYNTSDFSSGGVTIESVSDEGYNNTGGPDYEYLNITANITFSDPGNYEIWCDLSKESNNNWYWIGWTNEYKTVSSSDSEEQIILQFNGEQISSSECDGPYNIHLEVENLDEGRRVAKYDGTTSSGYQSSDFIGSTIEFNESEISDTGVDTDGDGNYNYLSIDVPVNSDESGYVNCELTADLRKQSNYNEEWISWTNNWTSIPSGESTINIRFEGEIMRNSGLNGPYSLRLELRNTDTWKLLDSISDYETSAYSYDNFDAAAASINTSGITNWGNDTDNDDKYDYLDVNVSINVGSDGYYRLEGELYSDTSGWQWIDNTETYTYLEATDDLAILHFDGVKIRNKGLNSPYKARIELRQDGRMIDSYEPYQITGYSYDEFQQSGAEIMSVSDYKTGAGDLQVNVTVNCSTSGYYWLGADLHKQTNWNWEWISWQSNNGNDEFDANEERNITIVFSGQTIQNSEIDGPYHIRLELRDVATWTEQDMIEQYTTDEYSYSEFATPDVTLVSVEDWGNDTVEDEDDLYNYLELNVTVDSASDGTYWMHGDLEKRSGYDWHWITWKGQQIELDGTGEQVVKLKFDGERIYDSAFNGPYTVRIQIMNETTWTMIDSIDDYSTSSYNHDEFQRSTVTLVDDDTYPFDQGVGSEASYSGLQLTVAVNSTTGSSNEYWLQCDLHKESPGSWQWIDWQGETITHNGNGVQLYNITFDGAQIRNKGIDGPYDIRIELCSNTGEWRQYDIIEQYQTNDYDASDFASAGIEFVDMIDGAEDEISNGDLKINVTVNSTVSGKYKINGDLHQELGYSWQWISFNTTEITVNPSGVQTFNLLFDGGDIYDKGLDGPYHVRLELRKVGTDSLIDTIDRYTTSSDYDATDFSAPVGHINGTNDTSSNGNLKVNISTYSAISNEYQYSGVLLAGDYTDIAWSQNTTTVNGETEVNLSFDGSLINASGKDPEKIYIEMRRASDMNLIDSGEFDLVNIYSYDEFGASVSIGEVTFGGVYDSPGSHEGYDYLNISANITFNTAGSYSVSAALVDPNGTFITGKKIPATSYTTGERPVNFSFDGLKIYAKKLNGPYTVSYVAVSKTDIGEITRATNVFTTAAAYAYTDFEHNTSAAAGYIMGNYSSSFINSDADDEYEYLAISMTINVTSASSNFDVYGDLYSSSGSTWITSDSNNSNHNTLWTVGEKTVTLYFEGNNIYSSETDGPYMLGYLRIGANISGTWVLLDEASNVHTTASCNYTDFENETVGALTASGVSEISASNDPFSPNSDGTKDTTLITVSADGGQDLYLNIYNATSVLEKTGISLSETSFGSGTYTATWNGKDDNTNILSDGTYRIKVSDEATGNQANESDTTQTIVIDTAAPTGVSFEIENNDQYTNTTSVSLTTISATDNSSKKMQFKNAGGNYTDWEDFQSTRDWTLTSTDGSKTVYYQVKDTAGNIATAVSDGITLDTTKPSSVTLTITGKGDTPATYSNDQSVTLSISAEDATSGVEYMMIANEMTFSGRTWVEYNTSKEWSLTSSNGIKTVYIKVKDRAGKISDVNSDNITLDTTTPTNLDISINSDQPYTNSTNATLTLSASDTYNMKMRFNNSGSNWSSWESYNEEKANWQLSSGSGTKTVNFQVKDLAGNSATAVSDTINLDTTAPSISNVQSSGITQTSATITWTTDESSTSTIEYGTTTDYGTTSTNSTKVTSHTRTLTGLSSGTTYHYQVKSQDRAGNIRTSVDKTFSTSSGADTTPPNAIEGVSATDKANAESTITLSWNQSNAPDFAGYKVYRRGSTFTNVTSSNVQLLTTITTRSTTTYDDTTATDGTTFYYAVTAIDTATPPNENQTVTSQTGISVDDKPPTTTDNILSGWQTSDVTVTFTPTDNGKGVNKTYYTTDGSDPTNNSNVNRTQYAAPFTIGGENELGDDIWTIKFYSYDKNTTPNIENTHTETLRVDTTDPSTSDDGPSGWQTTTPVTVTLNATDDTSGIYKTYYTKDGSDPTQTAEDEYSTAISFTSQGNRTLKYFSKDNATNTESIKTTHILIDTVRPTSEITTLSQYNSIPVNVSWTSSDASSDVASCIIQTKNGSEGTWTTWLTGQNANGYSQFTNGSIGNTYYFRSIATDNAGNVENDYDASGDAYTTIVSAAMNASITAPSNNEYVRQTISITGTASGPAFSKYWVNHSSDNGSTWTHISNSTSPVSSSVLATWNTSLVAETEYILRLYVINSTAINNSYSINVTVDNTAPNITVGPSSDSVDENSAVISWTTNETTNATVEYGTTSSYGNTKTGSYATSHAITLTSLSASTTYHYRVISYDRAGSSVNSTDSTFTTDETQTTNNNGQQGTQDGTFGLTANANGPYEGTVGSSIEFTGSASGGTSPYSYSWDFGDASSSTEQNPTHSYSSADTYTATLTVTDDTDSTATDTAEVTISEATQDNPPTISSIYHTPTKVTKEDTITIYATVTDDTNLLSVNLYYDDGSEHTTTMSISNGNTYTATIGPFTTGKTITYSIDATDSASQTTQSTVYSFKVIGVAMVGNVTTGESKEAASDDAEGTGVDSIEFTANTDLTDVKVTIEKVTDTDNQVPEEADKHVYSYLEIDVIAGNESVNESDIQSLKIKFKVPQSWFTENNIDKETVTLMRYHNGEWIELETTILNEDETYVYYQAISPGTSSFAIIGSEITEISEPEETSWYWIILAIVAAIVIVVVVLFKAGYLYLERKPPKK